MSIKDVWVCVCVCVHVPVFVFASLNAWGWYLVSLMCVTEQVRCDMYQYFHLDYR